MRCESRSARCTHCGRTFVLGLVIIALVIVMMLTAGGCVRRTLTITSEPPGALCWLNGREVGRTPVTVDFLHYGVYDVQLTMDGYEPLLTSGDAKSPWWDTIPLDLAAEAVPGEPHADIRWHYVMQPRLSDRGELVDRAEALRHKLLTEAPIPPGGVTTQPETDTTTNGAATQPATTEPETAEPGSATLPDVPG